MEYTIKGPDPWQPGMGWSGRNDSRRVGPGVLATRVEMGGRNAHWKTLRSAAEEKGLTWITVRRAAKTLGVKKGR